MTYFKAKTAIILLLGFVGTQAYPTSCKGVTEEEIVLLPNPANCSTYIACVGEEQVVLPCPVDLEWNDKTKLCDYPNIANCQERIQETEKSQYTSCERVPSNIDVLLPNPADCESYIQCIHGQPVVRPCPPELHWSVAANRCEWPEIANCRRISCEGVPDNEDVLLPNPEDCGSYIQCVNQEPVVRSCPTELHWNAAENRCDWPNVANCNVASQTVSPRQNASACENVSENEIVLLPIPGNYSAFIVCAYGKETVSVCPKSLQWNDAMKRCHFPEIAQGEEEIKLTPKPNLNRCEGVPEDKIVLLPIPGNCSAFIECAHGKEIVFVCPKGLQWNDDVKRCDHPEVAQCVEQEKLIPSQNWTSCKGVPENETVLLPTPGNCSTYIMCAYEDPVIMSCPGNLQWNDAEKQCDHPEVAQCVEQEKLIPNQNWTSCKGVPENKTVLLPTPGNCSTYILCANEKPVIMPCPGNLQWNDAEKQCDYPAVAQCVEQEKLTPSQNWTSCEGVPENATVLLPTPGNCSTYIVCANEEPVIMSCPGNLQWNDAEKQCDYPEVAQCVEQEKLTPSQNWTSCEGVPENATVLLPTPGNCSTYIVCANEEPVIMSCPGNLQWNDAEKQCDHPEVAQCVEQEKLTPNQNWTSCEGVPENVTILLPTPGNCSTYILCANEKPIIMPCPGNLEWNDAEKQCDHPEVAQCVEQEKLTPSQNWTSCEGVPENVTVLLPTPGNCSTYIVCANEEPVTMACPGNLEWNDAEKQCDHPEDAQCVEQEKLTPNQNWTSCEGVPENVTILLPTPGNCSTYILCANEEPVTMACPGNLEWNDAEKQCDHPEVAQCVEQEKLTPSQNWTSCKGVPENETVLLPTPGNCSTYIMCAYEEPVIMSCPGNLEWNDAEKQCDHPEVAQCEEEVEITQWIRWTSCKGVPSNMNVLLPNPADCESYIQCVHGQPVVRPCPPELHWSVAANRCEWPEIANCRRISCEGVQDTEDVLLPNPENCGTYIQCVNQEPVVRPCPPGLHWNAAENRCDWPNVANCEVLNS